MRAIIKYARSGAASYVSHLDMQRAFARGLRRSGLPVSFSEGFNPHIVMSFASPLSVGYATMGDYLEVKFEREILNGVIERELSAVMPADISIVRAGRLADNAPKLMAVNSSALYVLDFKSDVSAAAKEFFAQSEFIAEDRKGRSIDVKKYVLDGEASGGKVTLRLSNSSEKALNPAVIASILGECAITRIECFANINGEELPFYMLGK